MKNVSDYIRMLLYEHDYVTIPNLGAFIANYLPSTINDISGSLMPPQKRIAFNEVLRQDDGLLATFIARREAISLDESKRKIQTFVTDVKDILALHHEYVFDKIGVFTINQEKGLIFEPDRKNNFYSESFGFDSIFPQKEKTISGNKVHENISKVYLDETFETLLDKSQRKSSFTYVLYGLPLIFLVGGLFYIIFSNTPANKSSLSSVIPLDFLNTTEKITKVRPEPQPLKVDKSEVIKPDFSKSTEKTDSKNVVILPTKSVNESVKPKIEAITTVDNRYMVICGLFKNKENVDNLIAQLQKNGYSPKVVPYNNLLKVIAAEVKDLDTATQISVKLKTITGEKGVIQKK
jgi:hypothetical protein